VNAPALRRILVAVDGSPLSRRAVRHALGLARAQHAELVAVHVSPTFHAPPGAAATPLAGAIRRHARECRAAAHQALDPVARAARAAGVACRTLHLDGPSAAREIVAAARRQRCDLVVLGSHGRGRLARVMFGSVAARVLELCDRPVLVVRPQG
jgi:nucleotide-binding universal stress UspA family protein